MMLSQPITKPVLHFGLGEKDETDVARIIWPNGDVQAEFNLAADDVLQTRQTGGSSTDVPLSL